MQERTNAKELQKMKDKGTYEAYKQRLNVRRRKNEPWVTRGGKPCRERGMRSAWNRFGVNVGNGWTSNWTVPFLYRGCHSTGPTPSLRKTECKGFVPMRCNKWTTICKNKMSFIKTCIMPLNKVVFFMTKGFTCPIGVWFS